MKTLFAQLDEIYYELDKYFYDELTDYEKGVKDILNMLDTRMSGSDGYEIYKYIIDDIERNHNFNYEYYYQIDYIDENGLANYIKTFNKDERDKAIKSVNLLNQANMCINGTTTKYVLDYYRYRPEIDESDEIIEKDIKE